MADGGKNFIEPEKSKARDVEEEEENMDNSGNEAVDGLDAEKSYEKGDEEVDEEEHQENLDNEAVNGLQVCKFFVWIWGHLD